MKSILQLPANSPRFAILTAILVLTAIPSFSQVVPAAGQTGLPLVIGVGFSDFNVDFGGGRREIGETLWADWYLRMLPSRLQGLGLEVVARDISHSHPAGLERLRYDTASGGAIYRFDRLRSVHPYAKVLEGFGSIDFPPYGRYGHDTRQFFSTGGGADFHVVGPLWVRGDYEYQWWRNLFGSKNALTPNGFTIGTQYDFGTRRSN